MMALHRSPDATELKHCLCSWWSSNKYPLVWPYKVVYGPRT